MLNRVDILAILALAICPAYSALGVAFAVLGLAAGLGALAFDFTLDAGFVGLEGEHIIEFAVACLRTKILKARELR